MRAVRPPTNPIVRSAFPVLLFFLAVVFSGIFEKAPFLAPLHPLMILGGLALIAVGVGGRLPGVVVHNPIGKSLAAFTVWYIVCIPFARWPGGSASALVNIWSRSALAFVLVAGVILTIDQCKTVFKTIGYSVGVLAILALILRGVDRTGRLGLIGTRYENANDFAWTLIVGLSFLTFLIMRGNRREKTIAVLLSAPILLALVKTGSRMGSIGIGILAVFGFLQASRAVRIKLAIGVPILLALLLAVAPPEIRLRYTIWFGTGENYSGRALSAEERTANTAIGSAEGRVQSLKDSIYLTLIHPVFGVGPGNFPVAQNDLAMSRGESRGLWVLTHNTYTQISSEMGIPGLVIYLAFLYLCFKPLNSILHTRYAGKEWHDLQAMAKTLRVSLIAVLAMAVFDSYGYDVNIPILAGICCALGLIAQRQRAVSKAANLRVLEPVPEPVPEPALMAYS